MWDNCVHFVASDKEAGVILSNNKRGDVCQERSAGHTRHEYTTGYAYEKILDHFEHFELK